MSLLTNLRIGRRLGGAFALCIALSVVLALYARSTLGRINAEIELMVNDRMVKVEELGQFKDNVNAISLSARNIVLVTDEAVVKREVESIAQLRQRNMAIIKALDESLKVEKARQLLQQITAGRIAYAAAIDRAIEARRADNAELARDLVMGEARDARDRLAAALNGLIQIQKELMQEAGKSADQMVDFAGSAVIVMAAVAAALGTVLALTITRSVVTPIRQALDAAETVAGGDLRLRLAVDRQDEAGQLLAALQRMNDSLVGIVSSVRGNAESWPRPAARSPRAMPT